MKRAGAVLAFAMGLALSIPSMPAQDKPKADEKAKVEASPRKSIPTKVRVVLTEFDGPKKLKSLPYEFAVTAWDGEAQWAKLRVGSRVPVATGTNAGGTQFQYIDVGTNIDCRAFPIEDGRFVVDLNLERSWVEGDIPVSVDTGGAHPAGATAASFNNPIIRQFSAHLKLLLRDGQAEESSLATDPLSGKVMRVEVTLTIPK